MRRIAAACTAALAAASLGFAPVAVPALDGADATDGLASSVTAPTAAVEAAGRTIVVFHDTVRDVPSTTQRLLAPLGLTPVHVYQHALRGFAVAATPAELADVAADSAVDYLEGDREVRTAAQVRATGVRRIDGVAAAGIGSGNQTSVDIAILDTGIASHPDLRVVERLDCTDTSVEPTLEYTDFLLFGDCKQGGTDNDGHGTHVAGIAGARDNTTGTVGVAPGARLWAIKVIDRTSGGSLSDVVRGVDEVARRADTIEVANISLVANGRSNAMDDAIEGATERGAVIVVAAGNASRNASGTTPANSPDAITVSAVTDLDGRAGGFRSCSGSCAGGDDRFASYSNFGSVVDIAAPGSFIQSTARNGGTEVMSGTSMASPHVAGAAGLRIAQQRFSASASRADRVLGNLLATSARENSFCGYRGSPSGEKLLDLRLGC